MFSYLYFGDVYFSQTKTTINLATREDNLVSNIFSSYFSVYPSLMADKIRIFLNRCNMSILYLNPFDECTVLPIDELVS